MVSVTAALPATNFSAPSSEEARRLMKIVDAACPWLTLVASVELDEFRAAFAGCGYMFRVDAPVSKYAFTHFLDAANELIMTHARGGSVGGVAFLGAILAHGDIVWRKADASLGQLLEIGLDPYSGKKCSNAWRGLLTGERNVMQPTSPPASRLAERDARRSVNFYKQAPDGTMRAVRENENLWSR